MDSNRRYLADKCRHCCAVFHELRRFQKEELLCDVNVLKGSEKQTVKAHRVVLMSSKSFDSDYSSSDTDSDEESLPTMSCSDEAVFEEAYASEDEMSHITEQMEHINTLRRRGECCDVTLQAGGVQYKAHKCVLAAASEYFKIMFTASMREKNMHVIKINIDELVDSAHFHDVIDYIYTGELWLLDDNNILPILCLSAFFQIATLTKLCQSYLISRVSKVNCCNFYVLAKCFALEDLKSESWSSIHDHFSELEGISDDVNLLESIDLPPFLRSDNLGQRCSLMNKTEARVLNNVMEWLSEAKYQGASELLCHIRFSLVPRKSIVCHKRKIDGISLTKTKSTGLYVEGVEATQKFLQKALEYHENVYEQPLLQKQNSRLRCSDEKWICMDGVLAPEAVKLSSACFQGKLPTKEQRKGNPSDKIRDPFHSVVVLKGFVYVMGGTRQTAIGYSRQVLRYDSRLDIWVEVASMNEERGDFYACTIGNYIFVFGGRNKRGPTRSCERYDPKHNRWDMISDLPQGLYMAAGVVESGKVYLSGGFNEHEAVGTTLRYHPDEDRWDELPCFLFKDRGYHVLVNDQRGFLWAIGGVDNPFAGRNVWEVERFDVENEMWDYVGQVLAVHPFLSIQRLNAFSDKDGCICVFAVTNIDHSPMLRYNINENLWEKLERPVDFFEIDMDQLIPWHTNALSRNPAAREVVS